jgi:hypothetical protein
MCLKTSPASTSEEALLMPSLHIAGGRHSMLSGHSCWMMNSLVHTSTVIGLPHGASSETRYTYPQLSWCPLCTPWTHSDTFIVTWFNVASHYTLLHMLQLIAPIQTLSKHVVPIPKLHIPFPDFDQCSRTMFSHLHTVSLFTIYLTILLDIFICLWTAHYLGFSFSFYVYHLLSIRFFYLVAM